MDGQSCAPRNRRTTGAERRFRDRSGNLKVLVVGGSLGAQILNETVPLALALIPRIAGPTSRNQAGEKHIAALQKNYRDAGVNATSLAFIHDMAGAYADADLVICRAGALTIAELAVAGVASVLVPFPHAVDDHQTHNARFLSDKRRGSAAAERTDAAQARRSAARLHPRKTPADGKTGAFARKPDATRAVAEHCMAAAG